VFAMLRRQFDQQKVEELLVDLQGMGCEASLRVFLSSA
jgi:hypothetical protein